MSNHLVLVLAKVPLQLPSQPCDGFQGHLVSAAKGVNSQREEGGGIGADIDIDTHHTNIETWYETTIGQKLIESFSSMILTSSITSIQTDALQ